MFALGKYEVFDRLGRGGMGSVYRAAIRGASGFRKPVAIKRIHRSGDRHFELMFIREAKTSALLQHPNIVQTLDFDHDPHGNLFLVMELVEGKELAELIEEDELPVPISVGIIEQILEALAFAQSCPTPSGVETIVHRDISPSNILITWEGFAKLSDFGIARAIDDTRLTEANIVKGKPRYMSPEQIRGENLDTRSDLFAVGTVFWEMLAGEGLFCRPHDSDSNLAAQRVLHGPIPAPSERNPDVPEELSSLCLELLARDREQRIRSAAEALERLQALQLGASPRKIAKHLATCFARPPKWSPDDAADVSEPILLESSDIVEGAPLPTSPAIIHGTRTHSKRRENVRAFSPLRLLWVPPLLAITVATALFAKQNAQDELPLVEGVAPRQVAMKNIRFVGARESVSLPARPDVTRPKSLRLANSDSSAREVKTIPVQDFKEAPSPVDRLPSKVSFDHITLRPKAFSRVEPKPAEPAPDTSLSGR